MIKNEIKAFFHCPQCLAEQPNGVSMRDWSMLEVGWTVEGLQVWCMRHETNVVQLNFNGQKILQTA